MIRQFQRAFHWTRSTLVRLAAPVVLLAIVAAAYARPQQPADNAQAVPANGEGRRRIVVGTRNVPPFAMKDEEGQWNGISIDLLREVMRQIEESTQQTVDLQLQELSLKELLGGVENGQLDLAVAAITVNYDREQAMDFSHPFFSSGLGIAIPTDRRSAWWLVLERIVSLTFLKILAGLFVLLLISGVIIYYLERHRNPEQFGGNFWRGLGAGVWWSIVTLTTVGYGDKAPKTSGGRAIAVIWMLSSILVISTFTAAVTSALTVGQIRSRISGPSDLPRVKIGTVKDSTSQSYLRSRHMRYRTFPEADEALVALENGEVECVVYDAPLLRYRVLLNHPHLRVLPLTFEAQNYAFALPSDSPLRESVNRAVLRVISNPTWEETLAKYLGPR